MEAAVKLECHCVGKGTGSAQFDLPAAQLTTQQTLAAIESVRAQSSGIDEQFGNILGVPQQLLPTLPQSERAKFQVETNRLINRTFLEAREVLRGGGQITDFESRKAEGAISDLEELEQAVRDGYAKLQAQANTMPGYGGAQQPPTSGQNYRAFKASIFRVWDTADQTKLLALDLSGLTTATIRTLVVQDHNGSIGLAPVCLASVATTSGSIVNLATGLPAWVTEFTVNLTGVSTNGGNPVKIQLGDSGGFVTTNYKAGGSAFGTGVATSEYTDGFGIRLFRAATATVYGSVTFTKQDLTTNVWCAQGILYDEDGTGATAAVAGRIILTTPLSSPSTTADTFDAGSGNVKYS